MKRIDTQAIPVWAFPYIFNADTSGLSNEQMRYVLEWCAGFDFSTTTVEQLSAEWGDHYNEFNAFPEFGLPCATIECNIWRRN